MALDRQEQGFVVAATSKSLRVTRSKLVQNAGSKYSIPHQFKHGTAIDIELGWAKIGRAIELPRGPHISNS